jgi:hypothetical protein
MLGYKPNSGFDADVQINKMDHLYKVLNGEQRTQDQSNWMRDEIWDSRMTYSDREGNIHRYGDGGPDDPARS